jgi:hypothetical protein
MVRALFQSSTSQPVNGIAENVPAQEQPFVTGK